MKQSRYQNSVQDKMEDSSCPTENRCRKSSSREFRRRWGFHSYSLHRQRCDPTLGARHEDANVRRSCRVKETSRARSINHTLVSQSIAPSFFFSRITPSFFSQSITPSFFSQINHTFLFFSIAEKRQRVRDERLVGGNDVFEEGIR